MVCDGPNDIRKIDGGCAENAQCGRDARGEYICLCNDGYEGDPYGEACHGKALVRLSTGYITFTPCNRNLSIRVQLLPFFKFLFPTQQMLMNAKRILLGCCAPTTASVST